MDGEPNIGPRSSRGGYYVLVIGQRTRIIPSAVKGPNGHALEPVDFVDHPPTTAHGRNGREVARKCHGHIPGSISSQAQTGQINSAAIHVISLDDFIQQMFQQHNLMRPTQSLGALGRQHNEGEFRIDIGNFWRTVNLDFFQDFASLTAAVKEEYQRP